jgi:hypothetical protein
MNVKSFYLLFVITPEFRFGDKDWAIANFCGAIVSDVLLSKRNGHSGSPACRQHHIILVPRYHVRSQFIPHHLSPAPLHERYLNSFFLFKLFGTFSCNINLILFVCLFVYFILFLDFGFFFLSEEDCYACVSQMVASKKTKFITQTKLHFETIWRTSMILCRRHAVKHTKYLR